MLSLGDIKAGKIILLNDEPHKVLTNEHSKMGRMGAVMRTKLKNLISGSVFDKTFQGADKVKEAVIDIKKTQFLYRDADLYTFMDTETYEQFEISASIIDTASQYLVEGINVSIKLFDDQPIDIRLPAKVELTVTDAPPSTKGNTVSGGTKIVTTSTGAKITTPLFVDVGDTIIINTERGSYVSKK